MRPSIAFLHTAQVHVPTFAGLLAELAPGLAASHVVREDLLQDARRLGADDPALVRRVHAAVAAAAADAALVVCTCSTVGGAAEATPTAGRFLASRIDRAMADRAVALGPDILVAAALQSTLAPTCALLQDSARRAGAAIRIATCLAAEAWPLFEAGRTADFHRAVADRVRRCLPGPSVVVLAQASMAGAAALLADAGVPVLGSPRLGVQAALAAVARAAE